MGASRGSGAAAIAGLVVVHAWVGLWTAPARAQTTELYRSGLWAAYSGTDNEKGRFCGISTGGGDGRQVAIKQFAGETALDFELSKDSWVIPDDTPVRLEIQFDGRQASPGQAVGSGQTLSMRLTFEQSVPFMWALRHGRVLRIIFPDGNETPWTGGLAGSGNAITAFNNCREGLAPPETTQPFRTSPPPPDTTPPDTNPPDTKPMVPFSAPTLGRLPS